MATADDTFSIGNRQRGAKTIYAALMHKAKDIIADATSSVSNFDEWVDILVNLN